MTKAAIVVACTSLLALDGCALAVQQLTKGRRSSKAQNKSYAFQQQQLDEARASTATMPTELGKLEAAADKWAYVARGMQHFMKETRFDDSRPGDCFTGDRKGGSLCTQAAAGKKEAEEMLAKIITASLDAEPSPTSNFPVSWLVRMKADDPVAKLVDVSATLAAYTAHQKTYWSKKVKKSGAVDLVKRQGEGMCFLASTPHGKEPRPGFMFDGSSEDIHIRCVAQDPLHSYKRTMNDTVVVRMFAGDDPIRVKSFPIADISTNETFDLTLPGSLLAKAAKEHASDHRFVSVTVEYVVSNKVGLREVSNSGSIVLEDDIRYLTVAEARVVYTPGEAPAAPGKVAGAGAADEDAGEPPVAKSKAKAKPVKTARHARNNARRR